MGQAVKNRSRICPLPSGPLIERPSHLKLRTIMVVSLTFILTSTILVGLQPAPMLQPVPTPVQLILPPPEPDTLVYTFSEHIVSLEPTRDNPWVVSSFYDTLVSYDRGRTDRFRPLLVTEVPSLENGRISPDGLTYRFTIRSDSPLTPEDVEYSFERAMIRGRYAVGDLREALLGEEAFKSYWNSTGSYYNVTVDFEDIDNAVEAEGNDVVFHLVKIYPSFMQVLASVSCSILSKALSVEAGDWPGTEERWEDYILPRLLFPPFDSPLDYAAQGFGQFMLERLTMADFLPWHIAEMVLVRNDNYWKGPARLKRVEVKWIGDEVKWFGDWETRKQMFLEGDADVCSVPKENYTELDGVEGIRTYTGLPTLGYSGLYFNFATANDSPYIGSGELDGNGVPPDFFSDIDIRKAFAYSIDYDTIINEIYGGEAQHPATPVLEGLPFHNPDQECYTYDLEMARQHFQQAWGGEVWNKGFNVTLVFHGFDSMRGNCCSHRVVIGEMIKKNVESIDSKFHVNVESLGFVCWNNMSFCIDHHSPGLRLDRLISMRGKYADAEISVGYGTVFHGYNGSTIDSLAETGMNTVDSVARKEIYYELQRIYHEEVPGVPLAQPTTRHYQRDWVWGWYHNPAAEMNFYEMLKGTYQDATRNIIAHVEDLVDGGVLGADTGSSLTETLDSAITHMDNGSLGAASQKLSAFIDQVNALDLPVWDRGELTALAQEIIEVLPAIQTPSGDGSDMTITLIVGGGVAAIIVIVLVVVFAKRR